MKSTGAKLYEEFAQNTKNAFDSIAKTDGKTAKEHINNIIKVELEIENLANDLQIHQKLVNSNQKLRLHIATSGTHILEIRFKAIESNGKSRYLQI
jgi:hypothetical protein